MANPNTEETQIRVDHPGAYAPNANDVPKGFKGSVTKAGSHTIYFLKRKPTDNQVEAALNGEK